MKNKINKDNLDSLIDRINKQDSERLENWLISNGAKKEIINQIRNQEKEL